MTRKILVCLCDRANLGRLQPVMRAIHDDPRLTLQVVCAGTMPLARFGRAVDVVRADGFPVDAEIYAEVEGNLPGTMARSIGAHIPEFCAAFERLKPDIVCAIGDRYETLGAAIAAAYSNLTLVHLQGGEQSGSIDESARHAITKLAHYHVPATERAGERLIQLGESPDTILTVGCPSSDLAKAVTPGHNNRALVVYHPTTTDSESAAGDMRAILLAVDDAVGRRHLDGADVLWPNIDSGSDGISKEIRRFNRPWMRTIKNVPPADYLQMLADAAVCIGNSSSFIRDAGFFGTSVLLVGCRQWKRECGANVFHVPATASAIASAIYGRAYNHYPPSTLYGDGHVSPRIVNALATLTPYCQKRFYDLPQLEASLCAAAME